MTDLRTSKSLTDDEKWLKLGLCLKMILEDSRRPITDAFDAGRTLERISHLTGEIFDTYELDMDFSPDDWAKCAPGASADG